MTTEKHFVPVKVLLPQVCQSTHAAVAHLAAVVDLPESIDQIHTHESQGEVGICVHYDPDQLSLSSLKAQLDIAGATFAKQYKHVSVQIVGMDCADCAHIIEHRLLHMSGVLAAKVSYASQQMRLEFDSGKVSLKEIVKAIKALGYDASQLEKPHSCGGGHEHELLISLLAGGLLILGWTLQQFQVPYALVFIMASLLTGGWLTARDSIQTLLQRRFDIDVLMCFAAIGAVILGAWAEAALLLFLFSLGHALEHRALSRARGAVRALAKLAPETAWVEQGQDMIEQPLKSVAVGDIVVVKPGQRIPVDGEVLTGHSAVDQASITGESMPVDKSEGDQTFSGTINGQGQLRLRVLKSADDSVLSRMVRMVLEADTQKSATQRFTEKFVKVFVPAVLVTVGIFIVIPPLFGQSWHEAFYRAMAMLVAASPCALAIATPAAVLSAVARAAQKGVLIKGGMHLENLGSIRVIAFDKTGTLTQGQPDVCEIHPIDGSEAELLRVAASLEQLSTHPLAMAVVRTAQARGLKLDKVENMTSVVGAGLQGMLQGETVRVGSFRLFEHIPPRVKAVADALLDAGHTMMIVTLGERWLGVMGLADQVRPEAAGALSALKQQGISQTIMLTGDSQRVAEKIASQLGVSDVFANLLPEDKLKAIKNLQAQFESVAMVGDGVNDAPAMATATVGIAMGGAGTDVALEASDVALMADDLTRLPFAVKLSRRAQRVIRFNLYAALGVVGLLLLATMTGFVGIGLAVIIHEGSTLLVVMNALRLLTVNDTNGLD